jgi:hypothetical protein
MPQPKTRFEAFDSNGNHYTLTVEGQISRDKILQLHEIMNLLGGGKQNETQVINNSNNIFSTELSRFEKIQEIIQKWFSLIWFASKDVQTTYEQELKEPINLSTVSTYLSRMTNKGLLIRSGTGNNIKYKTAPNLQKIKQQVKNNY